MSVGEFEYALVDHVCPGRVARGHQVGFFAVRACLPAETAREETTGRTFRLIGFVIDHWPSGIGVVNAFSPAMAWQVADELSFVTGGLDLASEPRDALGLIAKMGPDLMCWVNEMNQRADGFVRFREWRAQRLRGAA